MKFKTGDVVKLYNGEDGIEIYSKYDATPVIFTTHHCGIKYLFKLKSFCKNLPYYWGKEYYVCEFETYALNDLVESYHDYHKYISEVLFKNVDKLYVLTLVDNEEKIESIKTVAYSTISSFNVDL